MLGAQAQFKCFAETFCSDAQEWPEGTVRVSRNCFTCLYFFEDFYFPFESVVFMRDLLKQFNSLMSMFNGM